VLLIEVVSGAIIATLASAQMIADSRLPDTDVNALLNAFFARYLVWPFRATPGKTYDATGAESAELGSVIYTSSLDLPRVPEGAHPPCKAAQLRSIISLTRVRAPQASLPQN